MKANLNPMSLAVAAALEKLGPAPDQIDPRLLTLRQLRALTWRNLEAAKAAEYVAHQAQLAALSTHEEIKVRIEILEEELGLRFDNDGDEEGEGAL